MPLTKLVSKELDKAKIAPSVWSWFKYLQKQIDYYSRLEKAECITWKQADHVKNLRELATSNEHNQCLTLARRIGYHGRKLEFPGLSK